MGKVKYTEEQIEFVKSLVEQGSNVTPAARKMCEHFGLQFDDDTYGRRMRKKMQKMGVTNNVPTIEDTDDFKEAQKKQHDNSKQRFIISWAQSDTEVHKPFLKNIESYAKEIDAEILIIAGRYKSPTSLASSKALEKAEKNKNTWDKSILPYLDANRHNLHEHLVVLSDVKIQPTSSVPLNGMNGLTGLESCIIGHPRLQMKSLPVMDGYPNKLLLTTGAITISNYTDTAVGKKGEFHHQMGFTVVELDGEDFHVRQVTADRKGDFYDLIYCAKGGEICICKEESPALIFGDLHIGETDPVSEKASFEMAELFNPEYILIHDAINSHSISHHEQRDPFILLGREEDGSWSLERELQQGVDWFKKYQKYNFITVRSNHCEHIDLWLRNSDWRKSLNKKMYLKYANIIAEGKAEKGIVPYVFSTELTNVYPLGIDESFNILGWELGIHSHVGVHGSRSSPTQLKNLPIKSVVGHSHVPNRVDGSISVGTLTHMRVGYNKGASGWMASNVVIHPNGKAQHINIINGKFTTLL